MSALFSPFALRGMCLANRIAVAPMCQYSAHNGEAGDWHLIHLGNLSQSGAALLFLEATAVEPEGRISPADLGLWCEATEAALSRTLASVRRYSAVPIFVQLAHAGRKGSSEVPWQGGQQIPPDRGGWPALAPSALPHAPGEIPPRALDKNDMARIRKAFGAAAHRAARIGLDGIELHSAHGYLLHQFLSPLANARSDEYGGSLQNRMRFPLEVFDAIRAAFPPDKPVGIRISASDWVDGGWDLAQSVEFAHSLKGRGCDFIDVSSGGVSPQQQIPLGPGYQIPFAHRIRSETGLPTIGVGLVTEPRHAESIIADGQADLVALARGMLYDPRWPWHAAAELGGQIDAPPQYWRCQPREVKNLFKGAAIGQR